MKLHGRTKRIVRMHMADYKKLMALPLRGIITYGGGLDIMEWIRLAEAKGYHATMTPDVVELR